MTHRQRYIENADVVMICISVDQEEPYKESTARWVNEVRGLCETKPIVFVLTKKDRLVEKNFEP